ncbi:hypothetical protein ACFQY7_17450 [Actinomadura luteofluorescens]|uniref:Uncharacterized protein n=1 Tax=Actinomadura luteofluorescens TaxID=46163 RepID=A0A7Y9EQ31_9ACTN|nr:hypothetical protein [Actinomadura luteofluorescens]NYD51822.1 hypothetical protein [Actinomadura luteofluorescens]
MDGLVQGGAVDTVVCGYLGEGFTSIQGGCSADLAVGHLAGPTVQQVTAIAREGLVMAPAGLALTEAHEIFSGVQHHLVAAQVRAVKAAAAGVTGLAD